MENLFLRVLTLSLTASLVLLPLLALAPRLHHRYAGRTFYVLWLLLAVRLVLPVQLILPEPAVTVELPPSQAVTVPAAVRPRAEAAVSDVPQSAGAAEPAPAAPEAGRTFSWTQLGTWLWLGGVAALLVYQGAGYALARLQFRGRGIAYMLVLITLMIPFQVLLTPIYITVAKLGWINNMLGLTVPFLMNSLYIFMARQFFLTLPKDVLEAARIDGLGHAGTFFRIILPLAKPIIITITIFNFTQSWNAYLVPATFTTSEEYYTLAVGLNTLKDTYFNRTNLTMAGVVVITLPMMILFLLLQRHFIEGIATSGLKE